MQIWSFARGYYAGLGLVHIFSPFFSPQLVIYAKLFATFLTSSLVCIQKFHLACRQLLQSLEVAVSLLPFHCHWIYDPFISKFTIVCASIIIFNTPFIAVLTRDIVTLIPLFKILPYSLKHFQLTCFSRGIVKIVSEVSIFFTHHWVLLHPLIKNINGILLIILLSFFMLF